MWKILLYASCYYVWAMLGMAEKGRAGGGGEGVFELEDHKHELIGAKTWLEQ